jgi:hypothetical protein
LPARHRRHHSSEQRKSFTITLESCSRSPGICVHDALETATTIDRNVQHVAIGSELGEAQMSNE